MVTVKICRKDFDDVLYETKLVCWTEVNAYNIIVNGKIEIITLSGDNEKIVINANETHLDIRNGKLYIIS